jgi:hypothetical protein
MYTMSHVRNLTSLVLVLLCLACKTEKKMNQFYFTEDGKKYTLKAIRKIVDNDVRAAPTVVFWSARVNINPGPPSTDPAFTYIDVPTNKPIIPIMYQFAAAEITAGPNLALIESDISSPYYYMIRPDPGGPFGIGFSFEHLAPFAKLSPMIEILDYTDSLNFHYSCKYGQAVFHSSDFLSPQGGINFGFQDRQGFGLSDTDLDTAPTIPAGTYRFAITFLYFELQD